MAEPVAADVMQMADAAVAQAQETGGSAIPPRPIAVGAEAERERLRALIRGQTNVPDPADADLRPRQQQPANPIPEMAQREPQRAPEFDPYAPQPEVERAAQAPTPAGNKAQAPTSAEEEFERELLERKQSESAEDPAAALRAREARLLEAERTMVDAAREFRRDPLGALSQLGITADQVAAQLAARGHSQARAESDGLQIPDDADPTLKALARENAALKRVIPELQGEVGQVRSRMLEREKLEEESARRAQRQLLVSQTATHIRSLASRMPTLRGDDGKMTTEGALLVRLVNERMEREMPANVDASAAAKRAERVLAEVAAEVGIKPKQQRAEAALNPARRPPVPIAVGATAPRQVAGNQPGGRKFDFDDPEQRQAAMTDWFRQNAGEPTA